MTTRSIYVERPATRAIHLLADDFAIKTRCGLPLKGNQTWLTGDETLSGSAATCKRCRRLHNTAKEVTT